jgi:predicted nucleic acid-binding protein
VALARAELLDVAGRLRITYVCPREVRLELDRGAEAGHPPVQPVWLHVVDLSSPVDAGLAAVLDLGEAAVLSLALERRIPVVCVDEVRARRAARSVGLAVTGTLGLLRLAKTAGIVDSVRPSVDRLLANGMYLHPEVVARFLEDARE